MKHPNKRKNRLFPGYPEKAMCRKLCEDVPQLDFPESLINLDTPEKKMLFAILHWAMLDYYQKNTVDGITPDDTILWFAEWDEGADMYGSFRHVCDHVAEDPEVLRDFVLRVFEKYDSRDFHRGVHRRIESVRRNGEYRKPPTLARKQIVA